MKKKSLLLLAAVVCCGTLAACAAPAAQPNDRPAPTPTEEVTTVNQKITAEQAKQMIEAGGVTILDVRTADEYAEGHIAGAILLPDTEIALQAASVLPDKAATILVYCRSGRRSAVAAKQLAELGYQQIYDFGGIIDWQYEVVK